MNHYYISTGSTEREVLRNFEDIVERSLPLEKVARYYEECPGAGKEVTLNFVTYLEERKLVGLKRLTINDQIESIGSRMRHVMSFLPESFITNIRP